MFTPAPSASREKRTASKQTIMRSGLLEGVVRSASFGVRQIARRKAHTGAPEMGSGGNLASVYVHWPFCRRRCNYCAFNKYIPGRRGQNMDHDAMAAALATEAATLLKLAGTDCVTSVFFGGGTPSLMRAKDVEHVLSKIVPIGGTDNLEVSLEANPSDLLHEDGKTRELVSVGVNRISLGLQAFSDQDLTFMNRDHCVADGFAALDACLEILPHSTSVDLIFGRPGQTLESWMGELELLTVRYPELGHVSLYQLTLERGTQLWKNVQSGAVTMPDDDLVADMYDASVAFLRSRGLARYEVSNFARTLSQESVHNKWYWDGGEYVGVGPGAHGRFRPRKAALDMRRREARVQTPDPASWLTEVKRDGHGTRKIRPLTPVDEAGELLAGSLRTRDGLKAERWRKLLALEEHSRCLPADLGTVIKSTAECVDFVNEGLLLVSPTGDIRLSDKGIGLADYVLSHVLASLDEIVKENKTSNSSGGRGSINLL